MKVYFVNVSESVCVCCDVPDTCALRKEGLPAGKSQ